MSNLMPRVRRRGFTLVELLVVIVVLAVLAAIVLPKFMDSSKRSKESALRSDLKLLRNAIGLFYTDTGAYPKTLSDLAATSAPAKGLDSSGNEVSINAADWHGPYLQEVPNDPISGSAFNYSTTAPNVGKVTSSATGNALDGTPYSSW
ncbi:MAG: type II secretion system protein GspG [Armatimonadota bacterium]|nr:type II secretion system protein GspG [Armatimonadota bacterium]